MSEKLFLSELVAQLGLIKEKLSEAEMECRFARPKPTKDQILRRDKLRKRRGEIEDRIVMYEPPAPPA